MLNNQVTQYFEGKRQKITNEVTGQVFWISVKPTQQVTVCEMNGAKD